MAIGRQARAHVQSASSSVDTAPTIDRASTRTIRAWRRPSLSHGGPFRGSCSRCVGDGAGPRRQGVDERDGRCGRLVHHQKVIENLVRHWRPLAGLAHQSDCNFLRHRPMPAPAMFCMASSSSSTPTMCRTSYHDQLQRYVRFRHGDGERTSRRIVSWYFGEIGCFRICRP